MIPTYMGMKVVLNDAVMAKVGLTSKPWHANRCYAVRIRKKLLKKHGTTKVVADGQVMNAAGSLIMNSATYAQVLDSLKTKQAEEEFRAYSKKDLIQPVKHYEWPKKFDWSVLDNMYKSMGMSQREFRSLYETEWNFPYSPKF